MNIYSVFIKSYSNINKSKRFFLILGHNLKKHGTVREVCWDKKPSQKRKERMLRPLTNICFSLASQATIGWNPFYFSWICTFMVRKNEKNKQTNKNTPSKRMSTQCTDVDTGRSGDFLLNISLTFNILPHFFRKLFCFHSGISTQKLISYRIQYGTFNLTK